MCVCVCVWLGLRHRRDGRRNPTGGLRRLHKRLYRVRAVSLSLSLSRVRAQQRRPCVPARLLTRTCRNNLGRACRASFSASRLPLPRALTKLLASAACDDFSACLARQPRKAGDQGWPRSCCRPACLLACLTDWLAWLAGWPIRVAAGPVLCVRVLRRFHKSFRRSSVDDDAFVAAGFLAKWRAALRARLGVRGEV